MEAALVSLEAEDTLRANFARLTDDAVYKLALTAFGDRATANEWCLARRQMEYEKHKEAGG